MVWMIFGSFLCRGKNEPVPEMSVLLHRLIEIRLAVVVRDSLQGWVTVEPRFRGNEHLYSTPPARITVARITTATIPVAIEEGDTVIRQLLTRPLVVGVDPQT